MRNCSVLSLIFAVALLGNVGTRVEAQTIAAPFASDYSLIDLGSAAGVPSQYGGVFILASEPNSLYIGGSANTAAGALYRIGLVRDGNNRITGFSGSATQVSPAPFVDGGIVRDPGGLISYARWPENAYAQINLSTGTVVNQINLIPLGVASSSASVAFIPSGYPGAGGMRIGSWSGGQFYSAAYSVGAGGIISISSVTQITGSTLPGGPEGWAYVPMGSPQVPSPSMIVSEFSSGSVALFDMDASGNPVIASRRLFVSGLTGAEGAAIDPVSGSFLFSTFGGGSKVIVVNGFVAPPMGLSTLTPGNLNFGAVPVGSSSAPQLLTLTNNSGAALVINNATLNGTYYTATSTCALGAPGLAPGASCTISITCTPSAGGQQSGSYVVNTGSGALTSTLQCSGTVIAPPPPPQSIPTGSVWSLMLLAGLLLTLGLFKNSNRFN